MEKVEADVALLMVEQVPPAFKDFTITPTIVAYPGFQKELPSLPSKGLLEHTFVESV